MTKTENIDLIKALSNANGVSGFEDEVVSLYQKALQDSGTFEVDHMLNCIYTPGFQNADAPTVMLDAHSDEVGFITQAITPSGTLRFLPVGSWIDANIAAARVRVKTRLGTYVTGVVASKPPHFMSASEKTRPVSYEDMVIDIGSSSYLETVDDYQIDIGAPIVVDVACDYRESSDLFFGKAFDCRIGVAAMIRTLKCLNDSPLNVNLKASLSAQEEVGLRGARVSVQTIKPDLAIVFEGCPADDTFSEPYMIQSALHKGPMLRHFDVSMITNPRFQRYALDIAKKYNLPVQESVRKGGGTNGAAINAYEKGVPAIVIGIPVRYAHTSYGFVSYADFITASDLAVEILRSLNQTIIDSF